MAQREAGVAGIETVGVLRGSDRRRLGIRQGGPRVPRLLDIGAIGTAGETTVIATGTAVVAVIRSARRIATGTGSATVNATVDATTMGRPGGT